MSVSAAKRRRTGALAPRGSTPERPEQPYPSARSLPREGLLHRRKHFRILWESDPTLLRHHPVSDPDRELPTIAFNQLRLYPQLLPD
jgi:hypothetical protein